MMMNWMKAYVVVLGLAIFFSCNSYAETVKRECVGRMQLELPGEADVAGYSPKRFASEIEVSAGQPRFQFADGQEAGWSTLGYTGLAFMTNEVSDDEYRLISLKIEQRRKRGEAAGRENRRSDGTALKFEPIAIATHTGAAWRVSEFHTIFLKIRNHVFFWYGGGEATDIQRNTDVAATILEGIEYRAPNEVPSGSGVCLPFAFIKDNGSNLHLVASTFRLKAHPDVTVMLENGIFANPVTEGRRRVVDPEREIGDVWEQLRYSSSVKKIEPLWGLRGVKSVTLAGKPALASFVRITRLDQSVGYGFLVLGYEKPKAEHDRSTRKFYMKSEPSHAISRKIDPVTESEFLEMALSITKSVKYRP
jgi:hypothetical protein